jgi:hypothetical protein
MQQNLIEILTCVNESVSCTVWQKRVEYNSNVIINVGKHNDKRKIMCLCVSVLSFSWIILVIYNQT